MALESGHSPQSGQLLILFEIYRRLHFAGKHWQDKEKLGGTLSAKQVVHVDSLRVLIRGELAKAMSASWAEFDAKCLEFFGRDVNQSGQFEDSNSVGPGSMQWYTTGDARRLRRTGLPEADPYRRASETSARKRFC